MIDNITSGTHTLSHDQISRLCDRRFGIGADGLIELRSATEPDDAALAFVMVYYNSDGGRATFCGNGARCACAFARQLGLVEVDKEFVFRADDGLHTAVCHSDAKALVDISMRNVDEVACEPNGAYVLDTGVPHYVEFVTSVDDVDIMARAPKIRYAERYAPAGVNVNFVSKTSANSISIRYRKSQQHPHLRARCRGRNFGLRNWHNGLGHCSSLKPKRSWKRRVRSSSPRRAAYGVIQHCGRAYRAVGEVMWPRNIRLQGASDNLM